MLFRSDSAFHTEQTEQLSEYSVKYQTKEKELEIVTLRQEQLEQETYMLRHRIIVGSVISLLGILLLGSLYARQRQRARIAVLSNAANEKEREFLELQKETEQRLTRKYIDGLESERERMATELHDDVCNSLLALEMNIRTISGEESSDLSEQLGLFTRLPVCYARRDVGRLCAAFGITGGYVCGVSLYRKCRLECNS